MLLDWDRVIKNEVNIFISFFTVFSVKICFRTEQFKSVPSLDGIISEEKNILLKKKQYFSKKFFFSTKKHFFFKQSLVKSNLSSEFFFLENVFFYFSMIKNISKGFYALKYQMVFKNIFFFKFPGDWST